MRTHSQALIVAELAVVALLSVACNDDRTSPDPITPTANADPVVQTCADFGTFHADYASLSDQQRQALLNTMSASASKSQDLDLMRGVVDLGDGYLQKNQTRMANGTRTLTARCASRSSTPATTAPRRPTPTPTQSPSPTSTPEEEATEAGPPPTRTPSALVGRWQGGAGDAFWYTFTAAGTFTMENRQTGVRFAGYSRVVGDEITLYGKDGQVFIEARSWHVESLEVFGEAIHTLLLDGDSYARDEYYN